MSLFEKLFKFSPDMFREGTFVWGHSPLWWFPNWALVLLLLAGGLATWWLYRRTAQKASARARAVLVAIRLALLAGVVAVMAGPALQFVQPEKSKVFTAVLVDTSRSMSIKDAAIAGAPATRIDAAKRLLGSVRSEQGLLADLDKLSGLLEYNFDRGVNRFSDPAALKADGSATNLFRSIHDMDAGLRGVKLAAVVLVTDGCRNAGGTAEDAARLLGARGVPMYVVGVGDETPAKDYEVMRVSAPSRVRKNSEVDVFATIRYPKLTKEDWDRLDALEKDGKLPADRPDFRKPFKLRIMRENTVVQPDIECAPVVGTDLKQVHLTFTPDFNGPATYTVALTPPAFGSKDNKIDPKEYDSVADNNAKDFALEIQDNRLPVLYIEGSPRLEYRFLRHALEQDEDFRLVGVLRLAADRFYVQGATPAESYLEKGFPTTPEQLFAFQAIILGDIEAGYFTKPQLDMIHDFVVKHGGGLLMMGGVNSFGLGRYATTPIADLLPVEISDNDPPYTDEKYAPVPTDSGLKHPLMRIYAEPGANKKLWATVPPLIGITPVGRLKLSAGKEALITQEKTGRVVLAAQNVGAGRVAAFTSGGSWYWQVSRPAEDDFHAKFWKQCIRWLAVGAKERLTVETATDVYAPGEPVTVRATVLKQDLQPVNDAAVLATIEDPDGNKTETPMDWVLSEDGVYQFRFTPENVGGYKVSVRVDKWDLEPARLDIKVSEPYIEFSDAGLKADALKGMAQVTGGKYYDLAGAADLPKDLAASVKTAQDAGKKTQVKDLWDMPAIFAVLLVIMGVEWFIRRRSGLA